MDEDDYDFPKPGNPLFEPLKRELQAAFAVPHNEAIAFDVEEFLAHMRRRHSGQGS